MQDLNVLYQVCVFRTDRKNKMAAPASDWLRHFRLLLWNQWTEFNETWQEARSQPPLPCLCFSGRWKKKDGRSGLRLAETFSTSSLKSRNGIQRNLTGSKISMSSTKFVFFGPIGKTRWPPWPLIGWDIFSSPEPKAQVSYCHSAPSVVRPSVVRPSVVRPSVNFYIFNFFSRTAGWILMKLGRDEVLMVPYKCCCFSARSAQGRIQGGAKIGHRGSPSSRNFFFRPEGYSDKPNG